MHLRCTLVWHTINLLQINIYSINLFQYRYKRIIKVIQLVLLVLDK